MDITIFLNFALNTPKNTSDLNTPPIVSIRKANSETTQEGKKQHIYAHVLYMHIYYVYITTSAKLYWRENTFFKPQGTESKNALSVLIRFPSLADNGNGLKLLK